MSKLNLFNQFKSQSYNGATISYLEDFKIGYVFLEEDYTWVISNNSVAGIAKHEHFSDLFGNLVTLEDNYTITASSEQKCMIMLSDCDYLKYLVDKGII